jgi:2-keto-4-pentenoate hydratase/2-oxohepta-3-ene-1,7-dioic acid hydratase in catechol pathway
MIDLMRFRSPKKRSEIGAKTGLSTHPLSRVRLMAPLPNPPKIILAIVNTRGMLGGQDLTLDRPRLDLKAPSTVIGPDEVVRAPRQGIRPEVELAAVIGARLKGASKAQAKKGIFGYTIFNDVTAPADSREDAYQAYRTDPITGVVAKTRVRGPLFRSKNHDTFGPMGPYLLTQDEISDTGSLKMTTIFNGKKVQEGSTSEYIFPPENLASYASQFLTLYPGDIISCGSVGWVEAEVGPVDPSQWVLPSNKGTLQLTIEGIGTLTNPVRPS